MWGTTDFLAEAFVQGSTQPLPFSSVYNTDQVIEGVSIVGQPLLVSI